jgi:hypothetical protein
LDGGPITKNGVFLEDILNFVKALKKVELENLRKKLD